MEEDIRRDLARMSKGQRNVPTVTTGGSPITKKKIAEKIVGLTINDDLEKVEADQSLLKKAMDPRNRTKAWKNAESYNPGYFFDALLRGTRPAILWDL
ncbi:hypothetical protein L1987_09867 [Smallanthus sonchifolius]|uniref:Uncharacterized protein n=1 Tax=Smallanthus sonchifolius TaxID=185202 RepID=A0ACB9JQI0_9ASTR|nr:hypothetical protein L1987_09867 [Smallanthus sonchifolius]